MVVAEEEEASRTTSAFPCVEHHVAIELRAQASMQNLEAFQVVWERFDESAHAIVGDPHFLVNRQRFSLGFTIFQTGGGALVLGPACDILDFNLVHFEACIACLPVKVNLRLAFADSDRDSFARVRVIHICELCDALKDDVD